MSKEIHLRRASNEIEKGRRILLPPTLGYTSSFIGEFNLRIS